MRKIFECVLKRLKMGGGEQKTTFLFTFYMPVRDVFGLPSTLNDCDGELPMKTYLENGH